MFEKLFEATLKTSDVQALFSGSCPVPFPGFPFVQKLYDGLAVVGQVHGHSVFSVCDRPVGSQRFFY